MARYKRGVQPYYHEDLTVKNHEDQDHVTTKGKGQNQSQETNQEDKKYTRKDMILGK